MQIVTDIGGTNMRVSSVREGTLGNIKKVPTPKLPPLGIAMLAQLARDCAGSEKITAVAGCIAGDVGDDGVISGARNLRAWEGTNIIRAISETLDAPAKLLNDAGVVGLGELHSGAGKGANKLAYVTVSTGVGVAIIIDGAVVATGSRARIMLDGVDIEDLISGTAVMKKFGVHPKDLDSLEERERLADTLAEGLRVIVHNWSPDTIVLGGSMIVGKNPIPLERVQESLYSALMGSKPRIKMAELGDNGGLWGGLSLHKKFKIA